MKGGVKMTDKLSPKRTANALAITAGIVSLICYILILVAPAGTVSFFGAIFHSIDLSKISSSQEGWGFLKNRRPMSYRDLMEI